MSAGTVEAQPGTAIPFKPDSGGTPGDLMLTLVIVMLALAALVGAMMWLQRRGALPFGATRRGHAEGARVLDRVWLSRTTQLCVVEREGTRLAIVESPRGVAIALLPGGDARIAATDPVQTGEE